MAFATGKRLCVLLCAVLQWSSVDAQWQYADPQQYPSIPAYGPQPAPNYMVDNTHNYYHVAPDKGTQRGPVWKYSGSLEKYISNLANNTVVRGGAAAFNGSIVTNILNATYVNPLDAVNPGSLASLALPGLTNTKKKRAASFWLPSLASLGSAPLAGDGYQFYRDVTDFGADATGATDAAEAINAAVSSWSKSSAGGDKTRCGETCGNTFTQGAIVYFPPGTYKICTPIIQYYYTQFIGDANDPPTIKGCDTFQGIGLIDTDPYIPGGSGSGWYVNQNQFFRQIRNFAFDLTDMPLSTEDNDQPLVPTGIHWQVAQATSLQNLVFNMPQSSGTDAENATTAVGIFMENGSGGFVSDLTFNGGNIGWRAGSQQYTARNLKFNNCLTAVQMVWSWGFNWQGIEIDGGAIGFNISGIGGPQSQGIGSISLIDSSINNVPVGILTNGLATSPNIVLDNTVFKNVATTIQVDKGKALLTGSPELWATGARYNGSVGSFQTGDISAPSKAKGLLDSSGKLYVRSRPQYETQGLDSFLVATRDGGCKNDGTGDQTGCLNSFLQKAAAASQIAYFPAGIYRVGGTVFIPTGSVVQGSSWSQIQGAGYYFSDMDNPKVMVQVGNRGDVGKMEIVEMLFSVQGSTAGAILMEWNTAAGSQGEACMWDSHFRVGGGLGTNLDLSTCPKFSENDECIAATLMFHVTEQASGYFENVWAWVADHDNDASVYNQPDSSSTQLAIFGARGMLIESQGPSWFYGSGSEHSVLYNYQLSNAKAVYMGHIQTESPYFQPSPGAPEPFRAGKSFPNDPDFSKCNVTADEVSDLCRYSWGLRIVDSTDVTIHSAGLYSFFNDFYQDCIQTENCQERILEVTGSASVVIYNLFTVATVQPANGIDNSMLFQTNLQRGFTTEVSIWLPLPGQDNVDIIYVGPQVFSSPTVSCQSTCLLVFPTSSLSAPSTISVGSYTTSFEYGTSSTTTTNGAPQVVFVTSTTTVTISVPSITISGLPFSNVNVTSASATDVTIIPSVDVPPITLQLPNGSGSSTPRVVTLPPWPLISAGPGGLGSIFDPATETSTGSLPASTTYFTPLFSTVTATAAGVTTFTFPAATSPITLSCPDETAITFATPSVTVSTDCTASTTSTLNFACPTTKVVTFLGPTTGVISVDCTLVTAWSLGGGSTTTTTTPLPVFKTYPPYGSIIPVTSTISDPEPTSGGVVVPCRAWFFFICISTPSIHVGGWAWILPPGIYPPGPPPISIIKFPPGFTLKGTLPPWPEITIDNNGDITTESERECKTESASICSTTTTFKASTGNGITTTTLTTVSSECETITGCSISGSDYSTSTVETTGTAAVAPVGTWGYEAWPTTTLGAAYSASVYSDLAAELASDDATDGGTVVSFTTGPTPSPTCASGTGCGGHVCSGYYCNPTPTGPPPGFQDPKDPSSGGYSASTTSVGASPFPTLGPTGITSRPGSTCVSTATETDCALGPGGQTACASSLYCASYSPTSSAQPTPTGQVYVDIWKNSDCDDLLEQIQLNSIGQCYTPSDSNGNPMTFGCFSLTYISDAAENSASLSAFKSPGCFSQDDSGVQDYPDLKAIQYDDEKPFGSIGSISLGSKG